LKIIELLLDSPEVHRLLDYDHVLGNAQLHMIDRLVENPRLRTFPKRCHQTLSRLVPVVVDWRTFKARRDIQRIQGLRVLPKFADFWILSLKGIQFLLC
jgi:hypothetical protein